MKLKYGNKIKLIYTDTDSLIFIVFTEDYYQYMYDNKHLYDLSEYDISNKIYDESNKKVLGKMKDECATSFIREVAALRPKVYAYNTENDYTGKRIKGIKKSVVEDEITFNDSNNCLFKNTIMNVDMCLIKSEKHKISTNKINKLALCPYTDKRYLLNNIDSLAYGHFKINEQ